MNVILTPVPVVYQAPVLVIRKYVIQTHSIFQGYVCKPKDRKLPSLLVEAFKVSSRFLLLLCFKMLA
jgi:hypothetical protein